jgi:hypothetical protein
MNEFKFTPAYHKDGTSIVLYTEPFWCTALIRALDVRPLQYVLGYIPGGYSLFSKLIVWLDTKTEDLARLPAPRELLEKIVPEDEWLWGETEDEDEHTNAGRNSSG